MTLEEYRRKYPNSEGAPGETEARLDKTTALAERHRQTNPLMITDLERRDD